jgi:hypothetical protein
MKKPLPAVVLVAVSATLALKVSADAPSTQYAPFNYTDPSIVDQQTHLAWDRRISSPLTTSIQIETYCIAPSRLPTVKELLTLVDETPHLDYDQAQKKNVSVHIDRDAFPYSLGYMSVDAPFCTQTRDPTTSFRFVVDFATGGALATAAACRVRCVQVLP